MKRRALCLILASLMLVSATACSETKDNTETEKKTNTDVASTDDNTAEEDVDYDNLTDYEKRQLIPDNLPDVTYDGDTMNFLTPNVYRSVDYKLEIVAEELTGDACNDSVYNRNLDIENRFDVKIGATEDSTPWDQAVTMAKAGTEDYQVVSIYDYFAYVPISSQAVLNWREIPNIDLTQPWYNQTANTQATLNDRLYAVYSDLSTTSLTLSYSIFFNTEIMDNYGYPSSSLYSMVKEGTWTFDKFSEIVATMYEDKNGNGQRDTSDFYGFGYYIENVADVWQAAFDQPIVNNDGENLTPAIMCDKSVAIIEKLLSFNEENDGFYRYTSAANEEETYFRNELLAMAPLRINAAFTTLRDMEAQYSLLPFPKWDEAQTNYYTNADDKFSAFVIPTSSYAKREMIGTIFEAMSAESYKKVYPEYYDTALKGKYSSEPETAEMVDLIVAGRNFDFSFQFGETYMARMCYLFRDLLLDGSDALASTYKKKETVLTKSISKKLVPLYFDE